MSTVLPRQLYPPIEPYASGMLDVGDGHIIYWEKVGVRGARPAIAIHGGPGGSASPDMRRLFDPSRFDVLLYDQRGCGRSRPHAELRANDTLRLVADIERLRVETDHSDRCLIFGGSWGSLLGLVYAETYPEHVDALVLRGIFTGTQAEMDWFYRSGVCNVFPDKWERFVAPVPPSGRVDLLAAYATLLADPDLAIQRSAADAWCRFEDEISVMQFEGQRGETLTNADRQVAVARLENHFFRHGCFLDEGQAVRDARRVAHIPAVLIHGRYDMVCPLIFAWNLHAAWPEADLQVVEMTGHSFQAPAMLDAVLKAIDRFADQVTVAP